MSWELLREWIGEHRTLLGWLGAGSLVIFLGTLLLSPWLIMQIPAQHFLRDEPDVGPPEGVSFWWWAGRILRNLLGVLFILAGVAMLVLPGQGILTLLLGLLMLSFPGKRKLELWLIRRPGVLRSLNWIRRRGGRPPLEVPPLLQDSE